MKMKWLTMVSLSVLFFACSKDNTPVKAPVAGEKFPVKMSVSNFLKKVEQLPAINGRASAFARDSALATKITDLYYYINNMPYGDLIMSKHQVSTDADFGTLTDSLPSGGYYISVLASTEPLLSYGILSAYLPVHFDGQNDFVDKAWPDMFHNKEYFVVRGGDTTNNFPISLQRRVAQVEVNISDAPAIADSNITIHVIGEPAVFNLKDAEGSGRYWLPIKRRSQSVFSEFVLSGFVDINITYPDKQTNAILTKQIQHIQLNRNTKTILTGSLYSPIPVNTKNSGFSVQIQDTWNPSETINF